jgi:hypothetical protein
LAAAHADERPGRGGVINDAMTHSEITREGGVVNPLKVIEMRQRLVTDINDVLSRYKIRETISLDDITITPNLVFFKERLSLLIADSLWPSIPSAIVYHFTKIDVAEKILISEKLRLTNIAKRISEDEIVTFCKSHGLDGYLDEDSNGVPVYKTDLVPGLFYASFTDTTLSEEEQKYFWNEFGNGDGVRLKIQVTARNPNFRKIHYEKNDGKPIALLGELNKCIQARCGRRYLLQGVSRLCAFYLPGKKYKRENEYRALFKVFNVVAGPDIKSEKGISYIEVPLNEDHQKTGYKFEVIEVCANDRPNMPDSYTFSKRGG